MLEQVRALAAAGQFRLTQHAQQEMAEEAITLGQVLEVVASGRILEAYPEHPRGACGLINGTTLSGRPLHVVCTIGRPLLIIITVYEPKPPKWLTPMERGQPT